MMRKGSAAPRLLPSETPKLEPPQTTDFKAYYGGPITLVNTVTATMRPDSEAIQDPGGIQVDDTSAIGFGRHRSPQRRVVSTRDKQMKLLDQLLGPDATSTTHRHQGGPLLPAGYPLVYDIPPRSQSAAPSSRHYGYHNGYQDVMNSFAPVVSPTQQMSPLRPQPSRLIEHAHALHNGNVEPAHPGPPPTNQVSSSGSIADQVRHSSSHFGSSTANESARIASQFMSEPAFQSLGHEQVTTTPNHKSTLLSLLMGK